ncbi:MBL fold metallo-hydrolase [Puia sp. P3]|uniref:MBL fold metallo-hydrolase n=1 Tax=Puia sp. P3 TaxID=3423952 RepID=UPI003D664415
MGGDSGYGEHFKEIGRRYGPFDIALLECGQYGKYWPKIHMFPEQVVQAAGDLGAKKLMPVHWGKFSLALHPWNESVKRVVAEAARMQRAYYDADDRAAGGAGTFLSEFGLVGF